MVDIEVILFGLVLFQSGYFLLNLVELLVHKLDQLGVMSGKGVGARFLARTCFEIVLLAPCTAGCLVDKEALDKADQKDKIGQWREPIDSLVEVDLVGVDPWQECMSIENAFLSLDR